MEAARRLCLHGRNELANGAAAHPLVILFSQFRSPLVLILLAAGAISFAVGESHEASIIVLIVIASSGLGFYQEYRASNAVAALRARLAIAARVVRDGRTISIPAADVVPGDLLELSGSSLVPADAVVIEARDLEVDEAALTGESYPVDKAALAEDGIAVEPNIVHMGTSVRSGIGRAIVTGTGSATQFGRIAELAGAREPETAFARGVRRFGSCFGRCSASGS